ncbi:odorant receptor 46a-like [Melitaea cinxia]|uniref:odorant receptor 46a-like n=1 Tax=Melitaea cinxia TaxID=113334 RepID=UPI001E271B3F|nr:odorant receptor 46a-like [Melitaea cinxia]
MYDTFQAFRPHFNTLARVGYFKIVSGTPNKFHNYYRCFVWFCVLTYNLQHIIRAVQARNCTKQLVGTLYLLLTTLNTLGKQLSFNLRIQRVENVIDVINNELFKPRNACHENMMRANALSMSRLLNFYHIAVFICTLLFIGYPLIDNALGNEVYLTGYFPFDTSHSPTFEIAVIYLGVVISLQAYGHVTMDCTIAAFYAYAQTQLKILRYNLEHLVDEYQVQGANFIYFVDNDTELRRMLRNKIVSCIKHYEQIVWFVKEIESIFNEAMIVQFFIVAWVICMTLYKIVELPLLSVEFISMAVYLGCMLSQLFIYCFYGTHLTVESDLINESVYQSDWLSLSPCFRRRLLVLMERFKRKIEPRTARVIPLSVDVYISVLRSSYALFTILNRK